MVSINLASPWALLGQGRAAGSRRKGLVDAWGRTCSRGEDRWGKGKEVPEEKQEFSGDETIRKSIPWSDQYPGRGKKVWSHRGLE